jgi:hypothetical protein
MPVADLSACSDMKFATARLARAHLQISSGCRAPLSCFWQTHRYRHLHRARLDHDMDTMVTELIFLCQQMLLHVRKPFQLHV